MIHFTQRKKYLKYLLTFQEVNSYNRGDNKLLQQIKVSLNTPTHKI